jgi:hypothetical protein
MHICRVVRIYAVCNYAYWHLNTKDCITVIHESRLKWHLRILTHCSVILLCKLQLGSYCIRLVCRMPFDNFYNILLVCEQYIRYRKICLYFALVVTGGKWEVKKKCRSIKAATWRSNKKVNFFVFVIFSWKETSYSFYSWFTLTLETVQIVDFLPQQVTKTLNC